MSIQGSIAASINPIVNQSDVASASSQIMGAIKTASAKTGVDFSYLLKKATQESNLNPTAQASNSSASGLFQFTGQTWLQMVKNYGSQYGLGDYASQITADANGHLSVSDSTTRKAILALRSDPTVSAEMAGELDKQNAASLQQNVGGKIGGTELYLAHFLGASGASNFLSEMRSNPNASAAAVLPTAAAANPSVFYNKSGQPRSLSQIYQHFAEKFEDGPAAAQIASAAPTSGSIAAKYMATQTTTPTAIQVASLYTPATPASPYASSSIAAGTGLPAVGGSVTTSGASTLFTAMVLGQMNQGFDPSSQLNSANDATGKKKDALPIFSAVA